MLKYNLNNWVSLSNAAFGGNGKGTGKITIPNAIGTQSIVKKLDLGPVISESKLISATKSLNKVAPVKEDKALNKKIQTEVNNKLSKSANKPSFGQKLSMLDAEHGETFNAIGSAISGINASLIGDEKTGKGAETAHSITNTVNSLIPSSGIGSMANAAGGMIGNLIGGTKDRVHGTGSAVVGTVSKVASNFGPVGMAVGAALNLLNGIGGKRVDSLADMTDQFGSGYGGSQSDVSESISKYSGKKAGLFDFGFAKKGNKAIQEARKTQNTILGIMDEAKLRKSNSAADTYLSQNQNRYAGYEPKLLLSKRGMKFPELDRAREIISSWSTKSTENQDTQKFQLGGKMNLIPEGALHARKHNLEEVNPELEGQITKKGIPVITHSEGGVTQTAEIEKNEWTLRKEFTDQLESLYSQYQEDPSDDIVIEAGKLVCFELLKNTDDRSGLIKSIK